jgi:hypothetical protein
MAFSQCRPGSARFLHTLGALRPVLRQYLAADADFRNMIAAMTSVTETKVTECFASPSLLERHQTLERPAQFLFG